MSVLQYIGSALLVIIPLLLFLLFVMSLGGLVAYLLRPNDKKREGKRIMLMSLAIFLILFAIWVILLGWLLPL